MRVPAPMSIVLAAGLALAACDREQSPAPAPGPGATAEEAEAEDTRGITMRYDCGDGYRVAILGDSARVTTADGNRLDLPRVPDTSPPVYAGEAMELAIGSEDAQLSRDEGANWTCAPA